MKTPDEIKRIMANPKAYIYDGDALMADALACIQQLEQRNIALAAQNVELSDISARFKARLVERDKMLEQLKRERDALKADILRANNQAQEMREVLDYDVHPNCDYELYLALHDALDDVVAWEHKELLGEEAENGQV